MKRLLGVVALTLLGLVSPACEGGSSGGSDTGFTTEECSDACLKIDQASCGDIGQACVDSCVHHVTIAEANDCPLELRLYLDCFWTAEKYACAGGDRTQPVGCDEQLAGYDACAGAGGNAGAGGAADAPSTAGAAGAAG
jgi:hypothetical protein